MIVSIHQPNFMAWYPFFKKISEADVFVILTHCQYQKNGDQNRFSIGDKRYTMSVNSGFDLIKDKKYVRAREDWNRIKENLKKEYSAELWLFDNCITENMAETNISIINSILPILGIKTKVYYDYPTELKGTDRLVDICKFFGATTYLSGKSGADYLDLNKFKENNISVLFQKYEDVDKKPILEVIKNVV